MVLSGRVLEHGHTRSMTRRASVLGGLDVAKGQRRLGDFIRLHTRRGRGRGQGSLRPRRAGKYGVHAILLRGSGSQPVDQSGARSVRKNPQFKFCAVRAEKAELQSAAE
jgi:formate dehydrogenase major subunit